MLLVPRVVGLPFMFLLLPSAIMFIVFARPDGRLWNGRKSIAPLTLLVAGLVAVFGGALMLGGSGDDSDDGGVEPLKRLDRYDYLIMGHDESVLAAKDMMNGSLHIDCNLLEGEALAAKDLLPLGPLALDRDEIVYYNNIRDFYRASCCDGQGEAGSGGDHETVRESYTSRARPCS